MIRCKEKTNKKDNEWRSIISTSVLNIQTVLTQQPLGILLDIDGTLSPIAPTPDDAELYPGVASLLEQARKYAHVAIITGRAVEDGAAMIKVDGLTYIGTHGLEWSDGLPSSHPVHVVPEALAYIEPGKYLLDIADKELAGMPGIIVQHKRVGGSIHYRLSPNPEQARRKIFALLEQPARSVNMRLSEGKKVVELKTPLAVSKGDALRHFVQRFGLHGVIFAGDDRTDLDAIQEISQLRKKGLAGLSIVVQHADTLPALFEDGDMIVHGVRGMVDLLHEIVRTLMKFDVQKQ